MIGKGIDFIRSISDGPGAVPVHAFARQGTDEIAQALKAFPDSITPVSEPGQLFEPPHGMVSDQLRGNNVHGPKDAAREQPKEQPQQGKEVEQAPQPQREPAPHQGKEVTQEKETKASPDIDMDR